jgi:flagellar biosynthesis chaperone FliJ
VTPRQLRAITALLRLREKQSQDAGVRLGRKHVEVALVEREIDRLRKRRENVVRRGGAQVLRERLLLDALMAIVIERRRDLGALRGEAGRLLEEYREARGRRDAVEALRRKEWRRIESVLERRADEAASDLAAARKIREAQIAEEAPCAD